MEEMEPTDAELLSAVRQGDRAAGESLARRHRRWALDCAWRMGAGSEAEDVAHDALFSVLHRPPAELQRESLRPLLKAAVWQQLGQAHRRRARRLGPMPSSSFPGAEPSPSSVVRRRELVGIVEGRIDELGTRDRELVRLRYGEELSSPEISEELGMSKGAVRVALHRAMKLLRRPSGGFS